MIRKYMVTVGDERFEVEVEELQPAAGPESYTRMTMPQVVAPPPAAPAARSAASAPAPKPPAADGKGVAAVMSGTVLEVVVKPGDRVAEGDTLLKLEAMKMETAVASPADGTVKAVHVARGKAVTAGDLLVEFE